jgi:hypothetical protein
MQAKMAVFHWALNSSFMKGRLLCQYHAEENGSFSIVKGLFERKWLSSWLRDCPHIG